MGKSKKGLGGGRKISSEGHRRKRNISKPGPSGGISATCHAGFAEKCCFPCALQPCVNPLPPELPSAAGTPGMMLSQCHPILGMQRHARRSAGAGPSAPRSVPPPPEQTGTAVQPERPRAAGGRAWHWQVFITALHPFTEDESKSRECKNEEMSPLALAQCCQCPRGSPATVGARAGWAFGGGEKESTAPPNAKTVPPHPCQRIKNMKQEFV